MDNNILITVITCTYNAGGTLERTLKSVESQDYPYVEHLIVDGCSKDWTLELAKHYEIESAQETKHKVAIKSEPDKGLYNAMNKGIDWATGQYILFLNAGDTLPESTTLSKVAAEALYAKQKYGKFPGVMYGDTDVVDNEGNFLHHRRLAPPANHELTWHDFNKGMLVCHQAFYALASLAKHTAYDEKYHYSADVDWCIRIMKMAEREGRHLQRVPGVIAHFLDGGMTATHHQASLKERFWVMVHHYGFFATVFKHISFIFR